MLHFTVIPTPKNIKLSSTTWREDIKTFLRNEAPNEHGVDPMVGYVISSNFQSLVYDFFKSEKEARDWILSAKKMSTFKGSIFSGVFTFIK